MHAPVHKQNGSRLGTYDCNSGRVDLSNQATHGNKHSRLSVVGKRYKHWPPFKHFTSSTYLYIPTTYWCHVQYIATVSRKTDAAMQYWFSQFRRSLYWDYGGLFDHSRLKVFLESEGSFVHWTCPLGDCMRVILNGVDLMDNYSLLHPVICSSQVRLNRCTGAYIRFVKINILHESDKNVIIFISSCT